MIRNCRLSLALLSFALSAIPTSGFAQQSCVVSGATLSEARNNYTNQCSLTRVDCDPFNGVWYCASFNMNSSTPPALTVPSTPVVQTPTPTPPSTPTPPTSAPVPAPGPASAPTPAPAPPAPAPAPAPASPVTHPTCASASSDVDGDGFGWENNRTCVVRSNSAPAPATPIPIAPVQTTPVPTTPPAMTARPECARADSDPDGDGFGWENNQTCIVTATSAAPVLPNIPTNTVNSVTSAPTNNGNTTAPSNITAADITDLILVTGQSNALGAGTGYNANLDASNSRVFAFTDNGWQVASLRQIWDLNWHPRNHPNTDPSNNFALHFGKNVANNDSSRVIGFVLSTAPGARIDHWQPDGSFYNQTEAKVLDAINQLPHKSSIDGILWHQGESDGHDRQSYTDSLYTLINTLRSEPWVAPNAPFICGETKIQAINNRLNGLNRDSDPTTACVRGIDLPTLGDDRHFNAQGLRTLGARYADSYLNIVK